MGRHEHLYESIETNVIRSDEFADNLVGTSRLLLGSRVILCTLSMLSHPRLMASGFSRLVPIKTVIVDEASQIELGDYLPLLSKFGKNIRKLAFIGDNKQRALRAIYVFQSSNSLCFDSGTIRPRRPW